MLFKEAVSKRILELCNIYKITPNRLAELSAIAPSTLRDILSLRIANPSTYVIYCLCKTLKISLKDFYDSELFSYDNLID